MKKILLIVLPIVIILGGILGSGYYIYENIINTNTIYDGVKIDSYSVAGKTQPEALEYIRTQKETADTERTINLTYENTNFEVSLADLGYSYNYEKAIEEAYLLGREGNLIARYREINDIKKNSKTIILKPTYDRDMVLKLVDDIADNIYQESQDAKLDFENGRFKVTDDKRGITLNKSDLINLIVDNIYELEDINLPVEVTEPKVKKESLSRINGVISEFSTSFKGSSRGRIENVKISSRAMSNLLVMPGEQVSYNETIGPIKASTGYKEAPVILNGELTPGMGGGVCQSSTTLYNALLLANISIVERHPHSIAASYVPRGMDGAVATGYLDLKFKNNYDFPIYIDSKIVGDRVYFYVYGDTTSIDYTIKIEPELIETIPYKVNEILDPNALPGSRTLVQEGRTGYKVKTYKSIIKDGKVIERSLITSDYYRERDYIYKVGPALPETPIPVSPIQADSLDPADTNIEVIDLMP